ncbi:MAG TPA: hypothetical protein VJT08_05640, partial [Terriglobales bacterium]|nr:hypothetical protein [Terriglobales bacterium]
SKSIRIDEPNVCGFAMSGFKSRNHEIAKSRNAFPTDLTSSALKSKHFPKLNIAPTGCGVQ